MDQTDQQVVRELAAALAGVQLADLLAVAMREDGSLVVVVMPGPKFVFSAEQLAESRRRVPGLAGLGAEAAKAALIRSRAAHPVIETPPPRPRRTKI
jgi:hypothetical protein